MRESGIIILTLLFRETANNKGVFSSPDRKLWNMVKDLSEIKVDQIS